MTQATFKGIPIQLNGTFPKIGDVIDNFVLTENDLQDSQLKDYTDSILILNIFPSLDTPICSESVRKFNAIADDMPNTRVLCISKDLPFAQARFCGVENINKAKILSAFRNSEFAKQLGVDIIDGPVRGLLARAVVVLDKARKVVYAELVPEIVNKPDYEKCMEFIRNIMVA